jgi:hypothetical protein
LSVSKGKEILLKHPNELLLCLMLKMGMHSLKGNSLKVIK